MCTAIYESFACGIYFTYFFTTLYVHVGFDVMLDSSMPVSYQMCHVTDVVESVD